MDRWMDVIFVSEVSRRVYTLCFAILVVGVVVGHWVDLSELFLEL